MIKCESIRKSHRGQTDKLQLVTVTCSDNLIRLEQFPTHPDWMIDFWSQDSQSGSKQHYINPYLLLLLIISYSKCQLNFLHKHMALLIFTEFYILNQGPAPAIQPPPPPRQSRIPQNPGFCDGFTEGKINNVTTTSWLS